MFKDYFEYMNFIKKLKKDNFKICVHNNNYCIVYYEDIEIGSVTQNYIEIVDVNYLLIDNFYFDDIKHNKKLKELFKEYNRFINFTLENTAYKGE